MTKQASGWITSNRKQMKISVIIMMMAEKSVGWIKHYDPATETTWWWWVIIIMMLMMASLKRTVANIMIRGHSGWSEKRNLFFFTYGDDKTGLAGYIDEPQSRSDGSQWYLLKLPPDDKQGSSWGPIERAAWLYLPTWRFPTVTHWFHGWGWYSTTWWEEQPPSSTVIL